MHDPYQVAHDDLAFPRVLRTPRRRGLGGIASAGRPSVLVDTADRSLGGGTGCLASILATATRLVLGRDDLVERLVDLSRHIGCW